MTDKVITDSSDVLNSQHLFNEIENIVRSKGGTDYMDAIIHYCERHEIEIESIAKYVKKNVVLKAKLQEEAEELNFLQKVARLPV
jgi:hypothetical protein